MRRFYIIALFILPTLVLIGNFIAGAQKSPEETEDEGMTLAQLGVTPEQRAQIKGLWELKRQKQIQSIENLRVLNRLARDKMAADEEIEETLKQVRQISRKHDEKIEATESELIKTLPPRAQLHLIILGVLDEGLMPRRMSGAQKKAETPSGTGESEP